MNIMCNDFTQSILFPIFLKEDNYSRGSFIFLGIDVIKVQVWESRTEQNRERPYEND
jgi:hypothetical protein